MKEDKKNSFNTPEGYFESFNDRLMDRIQKEKAQEGGSIIPKTDGFAVPVGYFNEVTPTVLSKINTKKTKVIPLKTNRRFYYGVAAVAAIFILMFSLIWESNPEPISFDDLANAEIEAYFENTDLEMTSYEIAEVVSLEEIELNDILDNDLEDDIIMEYLDENVDDIEELNLEDIDYE
ncbi:hypothetical protein PY092_09160 [Muricauda sp. 334s03]|uniref:Uncharacterized protein n=1 Tax=Flagellimonas yonaguniensis TaxID=3031325 RepID=A0ABT5XYP4_9FLAO|nr:hypothetical protein [[Muricauda] yonaguniensis]MDF0716314.1 hypothetical protein [[Muricauda] yonaguniensis]